jgi:adenylate cyclase
MLEVEHAIPRLGNGTKSHRTGFLISPLCFTHAISDRKKNLVISITWIIIVIITQTIEHGIIYLDIIYNNTLKRKIAMTKEKTVHEIMVENTWRTLLTEGESDDEKRLRRIFRMFPSKTKCKWCDLPFDHPASPLIHLIFKKKPSSFNPRFCNICDDFAGKYQGGAEVELSMLFADIRGSTTLAEGMSATEFKNLIDRFYQVSTRIFIKSDAMIDKLIGDEVTAFYMPGVAGRDYARLAVDAAEELLIKTGHKDSNGPWAPIGVGIHTGVAFVGAVGTSDGVVDITALGDAVNVAARLASQAKAGEILLSEETLHTAKIDSSNMEKRSLELKGKSAAFDVRVMQVSP